MIRALRGLLALGLALGPQLTAEIRPLTILHTNDLHARLTPLADGQGGFARLATFIRRERAGCTACILLNAGDLVQGSPVSTIFHGLPVCEVANLLGFDAATLGNHEFDYGWMQVRKFFSLANYPIVTANMVGAQGQLFAPAPYVVLNVGGLRVGIIGAMTETLPALSTAKLLGEWHTTPLVETARRYARELHDKADLIVLLGHIDGAEETALLQSAPEIAVIVSGHIHKGMDEAQTYQGRVQVRVKSYAQELGRLDLEVDTGKKAVANWKWKHIPVEASLPEAPDVAKAVAYWEGQVTARVDRPLAVARRSFAKVELKALLERAVREETGADFAFLNLGGVRDILPKGQLLDRNIWNIMPFENRVVVGTFKGRDLPPVVLGGRTVEPDREYTLAVSDFTAANQGTDENLRTTGLQFPNDVGLLRDILLDWFRKQKVIE